MSPDPFVGTGGPPAKIPVLAYEKTGKDGKRWVLRGYRFATTVPDDKLADLVFTDGAKHPFK